MTGLYIFLGIILFILAVLMIPVHVAADYKDEFSLKIKFLFFFKYVIFPMKEKKFQWNIWSLKKRIILHFVRYFYTQEEVIRYARFLHQSVVH